MFFRIPLLPCIGIVVLSTVLLIGQNCLAQCVGSDSCDTNGRVGTIECQRGCELLVNTCEWYDGTVNECIDECMGYSDTLKQCLCTCKVEEGCDVFEPCVDDCLLAE